MPQVVIKLAEWSPFDIYILNIKSHVTLNSLYIPNFTLGYNTYKSKATTYCKKTDTSNITTQAYSLGTTCYLDIVGFLPFIWPAFISGRKKKKAHICHSTDLHFY